MNPRKVTDNVFFVGAPDWDRRLFDALIPLPQGTSYTVDPRLRYHPARGTGPQRIIAHGA